MAVEEQAAVTEPEVREPVVLARGLKRAYGDGDAAVRALRGVDLTVERGEFVAVFGRSGSGKSTLLHVIGTLERPDEGTVTIDGALVSEQRDLDLALLRRRRLGFVLQFFNLLPTMNALENVAFPLLLDATPQARERAAEALERVELGARQDHLPSELSGGEQQRVALARALVTQPALILADEPTGSLDSETGGTVLGLLRRAADDGETVLLVTHDEEAARIADRVLVMTDGRLGPAGDARSLG
jgi:putative ABC transport system ATP-binding protein